MDRGVAIPRRDEQRGSPISAPCEVDERLVKSVEGPKPTRMKVEARKKEKEKANKDKEKKKKRKKGGDELSSLFGSLA